ncbi:PLP-dependent transferase, partial [Wilcoxina mikolae CBS 423.85]
QQSATMSSPSLPTPSSILHRNLRESPHHAVSSSGINITLSTTQTIIDATGGASTAILGHTQPSVISAISTQMSAISYVFSGAGFTSTSAEDLANLVINDNPGFAKAIFVCSGSEAMEAALKLARQYHCERGDVKRTRFVSRKQSYHGNTFGALGVSGHPGRRALYEDMMCKNVSFVDACYTYRGKMEGEDDATYLQRLIRGVEEEFARVGTEVVAFIAETVSGASLACATALAGYFKAVREICDRYGALLILDEVMCGMGKTGTMHAWEQEGISGPDIQTVAKALGGGFAPIAGVLMNQKVVDALSAGTGVLQHGQTYQAHPAACAAAAEVQRIIKRENLLQNVVTQGALLSSFLKSAILPLSIVGDVRGRGLLWGVELIRDKVAKQPFERELNVAHRVAGRAMELGLAVLPPPGAGGDTMKMDLLILSPPYNVTEVEVRRIVELLGEAIRFVADELEV